jgi:hypothetical protein
VADSATVLISPAFLNALAVFLLRSFATIPPLQQIPLLCDEGNSTRLKHEEKLSIS